VRSREMVCSRRVVGVVLRGVSAETFEAVVFRAGRFFDVSSVVPMANLQLGWAVVRCSAVFIALPGTACGRRSFFVECPAEVK